MKFIKKCSKYLIIYICMVIIFFLALYITAIIPKKLVINKLSESAEILEKEGAEYYLYLNNRDIVIHNYTDAIMLNTVYSVDNNKIIESIIKCRRNYLPNVTKEQLGEKEGNLNNENGQLEVLSEFIDVINGKANTSYEYARYWHGYMIFLRPMLLVFNITQIRIMFTFILIILLAILTFQLYKNTNKLISIFTLVAFFTFDVLSFFKNIQGVLVMIIGVITSIFIASKVINKKNINVILFVVGGLTAYFDFLTTPLITILFPLSLYFMLNKEDNIKKIIKEIILNSIIWAIGYVSVWGAKWIINDIVYHTGLIEKSIYQIFFRVNSTEMIKDKAIHVSAVIANIFSAKNFFNIFLTIIVIFYICINYKIIFQKYKFAYLIIGIIPIMWYMFIANHSLQHHLYTYKLLLVSLLCLIYIAFDNKEKINSKVKNIIYVLLLVLILLHIIKFTYKIMNNESKAEEQIILEEDIKILEEEKIYNDLIGKVYENQKYDEPYMFDGFSYVEGTWQDGYVIQDKNGNEYVWVPCTNKDIDYITKIERTNKIGQPLVNYENCYNESYEEFIKSALQNGGFYISRYEIGKEGETPVSKYNSKIWTGITREEAQEIVESMYTNINCELINGYAYDTTLNWIESNSNKKIPSNILDNSYGKDITSGRIAYNNIYDIYDNVLEYSTENLYDTFVIRGFIKRNVTNVSIDESRYCICKGDSSLGNVNLIAIRTILYK